MSASSVSSDSLVIQQEVLDKFEALRKANSSHGSALLLSVSDDLEVVFEESLENSRIEDIAEELSPSHPRFIYYSWKHTSEDGRVSYPLTFIWYSPVATPLKKSMSYSHVQQSLLRMMPATNRLEARDADEMTTEWLVESVPTRYGGR